MAKARSREAAWATLRLIGHLLYMSSGMYWHLPPPEALYGHAAADSEELTIDQDELDAWLREVLGDDGGADNARKPRTARRRLLPPSRRSAQSR